MFSRFNLKVNESNIDTNISIVKKEIDSKAGELNEIIKKYICEDGSIDGEGLQNEWFSTLNFDVFISHSHIDNEDALKLAAWLKDNFGLSSFIDSNVWGSADALLKEIDKKYCIQEDTGYFDYDKRNFSTSHVHMMLSIALGKIMRKAETVILLNTPDSVSTEEVIDDRTYSPWIYYEISTANIIEKVSPKRTKVSLNEKTNFAEKEDKLKVKYKLDLDEFVDLSYDDLVNWKNDYQGMKHYHPLDVLYINKKVCKVPEILSLSR